MKRSLRVDNLWPMAAVAVSTVLAAVWLADLVLYSPSMARAAVFVGAATLSAASLLIAMRRQSAARRSVERYIARLCQAQEIGRADGDFSGVLPPLDRQGPWQETLAKIRDCVLAYHRDWCIADHARARAEVRCRHLAAERDHLRQILDSLSEPVLAVNDYDELVLANTSAQQLFGLKETPTEHRALADLVHCERLIELLTETRRRRGTTQRCGEIELPPSQSQSPRCFNVTVRTLFAGVADDDEPAACGAAAIFRDARQQKETQRRHAEFVSAVSHEMKTPLAGIKAYVELLADGEADDESTREEFLAVINSQADRLQRLIDNLLNIARIEAGVVEVRKQRHSLNELLEEALSVVQHAAEKKGIRLVKDLSNLYLVALVDRDMMLQTAINLLSNAIKYTPEGGTVTLRSRLQGTQPQFEVVDTGVGLSEEDCVKVFEKFYRVKSNSQMAPGTGLGLPLAKHIVEEVHAGSLTVESKLGAGSSFRVTLPEIAKTES